MTDLFNINQNQIDGLLQELSLKDKILFEADAFQKAFSKFIASQPSREILQVKRKVSRLIKKIDDESAFSSQSKADLIREFRKLSHQILSASENYRLFEKAIKLENMIHLYFFDIDAERRLTNRFPFVSEATLIYDTKKTIISTLNISYSGIGFFSPVSNGHRHAYELVIASKQEIRLSLKTVRAKLLHKSKPVLYEVGARFEKPITWDKIKYMLIPKI
jgi:hypothetical protein